MAPNPARLEERAAGYPEEGVNRSHQAPPFPAVRLRSEEIAAVKRIVAGFFGPNAEVRVFGSRARLDARGGDLDLHVLVPGKAPAWEVEARAVDAIERALDERHTDLLVLGREETPRRIDQVALDTGVLL